MKLSQRQQVCFDECMHFFTSSPAQLFVFSGVAGSGKSVIINEIKNYLRDHTQLTSAVLTLAGQASQVLRLKGVDNAQTIHSYLYVPIINDFGELTGFDKRDPRELIQDFIIIDEGSMLNEEILEDLASTGKKILIVGDENQLPGISKDNFNAMDVTDIRLEEIHRLAADNPIIKLSQHILSNDSLPYSFKCDEIDFVRKSNLEHHLRNFGLKYDVILCGTNKMRVKYNVIMREVQGFSGPLPEVGEKIMCLQNNWKDDVRIYNGETFTITHKFPDSSKQTTPMSWYNATRDSMGDGFRLLITDQVWHNGDDTLKYIYRKGKKVIMDKFDFAGACTVHKSQGSEYNDLLYIDENVSYFVDQQKFRYTGITRSKERITIVK